MKAAGQRDGWMSHCDIEQAPGGCHAAVCYNTHYCGCLYHDPDVAITSIVTGTCSMYFVEYYGRRSHDLCTTLKWRTDHCVWRGMFLLMSQCCHITLGRRQQLQQQYRCDYLFIFRKYAFSHLWPVYELNFRSEIVLAVAIPTKMTAYNGW